LELAEQTRRIAIGGGRDPVLALCLERLRDARAACEVALQHCIDRGADHADPYTLRLLMDGIDVTGTASQFLLRDSEFSPIAGSFCSEVLESVAHECDDFGEDPVLMACAEACRRCIEALHEHA